MIYRSTKTWRHAERLIQGTSHEPAWNRLASAYDKLWTRSSLITERIGNVLPGITLHDRSHFERLWELTDTIIGNGEALSPIETITLGIAICIHDIAHTPIAYDKGLPYLHSTPEWKDAELDICKGLAPTNVETEAILFTVMRHLHAREAEHILQRTYNGPGGKMYLLDDDEIRGHLSEVCGKIAASHHWSIEQIVSKLRPRVGVPHFAQGLGPFSPIRVACLLRVIDACQIDQSRAHDFAMATRTLSDESRTHWTAQNRLTLPIRTGKNLEYSSTKTFSPKEADSWWLAYQLIRVADKELRDSNELLRELGIPQFAVTGISGASSPGDFKSFITTTGWHPVDADIRISDPERVIRLLGGDALYGADKQIVFRELLQNAADAIDSRAAAEPHFQGKILIKQSRATVDGTPGHWVHIFDNGIGMSRQTLTTTLVDFGKSLKVDGGLRRAYLPLSGLRVAQRGRFGIGFFSTMMLSDHITVTSRRFDSAHPNTHSLQFRWGKQRRPLLLEGEHTPLEGMSTCVSLFVSTPTQADEKQPPLSHIWGSLIATTLNIDLLISTDENAPYQTAHSKDWSKQDISDWIPSPSPTPPPRCAALIVIRDQEGEPIGRACLRVDSISRKWHQGYTDSGITVRHNADTRPNLVLTRAHDAWWSSGHQDAHILCPDGFWGVLPVTADNAGRRSYKLALEEPEQRKWAEESLAQILERGLRNTDTQLAYNAYSFGADPIKAVLIDINEQLTPLDAALEQLNQSRTPIYLPLQSDNILSRFDLLAQVEDEMTDLADNALFDEGERWSFDTERTIITGALWLVPSHKHLGSDTLRSNRLGDGYYSTTSTDQRSFLTCMIRRANELKLHIKISPPRDFLVARLPFTAHPRGADTLLYHLPALQVSVGEDSPP